MDLNLPQSKSVPSNLTTGRRHRVSISISGSYQSHLSSLGHLHRVRTASEQIPLGSVDSEKDYLHVLEGGLAEQRPRVGRLCLLKQFITDSPTFLSDDFRRIRGGHVWRPRTLLTLYCCFSVLFLTIKIHVIFREALQVARPRQHQSWTPVPSLADADIHGTSLPPLMNITLPQRLSVAFRELSPQAHLDTFVVQAHPGYKSDLTACLWTDAARIEEVLVSATAWPGPVSLIVVTTNAPNSTGYKNLLGYLTSKHASSSNTSVHVLRVSSIAGGSSNAYLNMARFFARTSQVILFPDGIPKAALSPDHAHWLDKLPIDTPHPVLLTNATQRVFPSRLLAPVVLPRDHPVWCTERFYIFGSRILDWEDCLWKLWLESAGEASSIAVSHFLDGSKNTTALSVSPFAMKLRLRWSTKYRSEACAFTLKRSQALGSLSKTEKRHMQWRKKFCREVKVDHVVTLES
ncbi:hypothetical protein J3R82DRAFT_10782 [Butyriboletus roseoflavus]|nr:hypothetical protein J3R82DRAFT_10782 [Butyriboletus roseoflavus]